MVEVIKTCDCGAQYSPQDASAIKRHEATKKHIEGVAARNASAKNLETDDWSLETTPAKPKRERKPKVEKVVPITKAKSAKAAKAEKPKPVVAVDGKKACRVCSKVKPLEEFRVKTNRPDGRDTICASCAKQWLVDHKAKQAAKPADKAKATA